jgi:hypothetical protein
MIAKSVIAQASQTAQLSAMALHLRKIANALIDERISPHQSV